MSAVGESVEVDGGGLRPSVPWFEQRRNVLSAFVGLHAIFLVALGPTILTGSVLGDLPLYRTWAIDALNYGQWPGISESWVYPVGALAPILAAAIAGPLFFQLIWFVIITALNGWSVLVLIRGESSAGYRAAWWWMLFLLLMSPVALLRLEGLTAPLVVVGLIWLARRPLIAGVLLALAAWIKVWPAAVVLAATIGHRRRWPMLAAAAGVTAGIVATVAALGGLRFVAGFVTTQAQRGLQLEAPVTTPWLWMADLGAPNTYVWQNNLLSTEEVSGPGDSVAVTVMGFAMPIALALILVLMLWVHRTVGAHPGLALLGSLALVTALVAFNKVGSPQYILWIGPVVAVGVMADPPGWRVPSRLLLAIAGLTTLIFPILYMPLVGGDMAAATVLTVRNALLLVLLGWAIAGLIALRKSQRGSSATSADSSRASDARVGFAGSDT
ncbi:glycosyltransferase 87 family protein [Diaminobutyricibacter sp. McL0618]|uniref:glycosyltransferase 87 family protein n=1 Tax=Leifsonia sp. McL0618 TaxID=3415677 RepID=UPI003CECD0D8